MKILLTTDLHLDLIKANQYRWRIFSFLEKMVEKHSIESLYILGDLTEKSNKHDSILVNSIMHSLDSLLQNCDVSILMGNHDYFDIENPFFKFVEKLRDGQRYVNFVNTPICLNDLFIFIPNRMIDEGMELVDNNVKFLCVHEAIKGFKYESGKDSDGFDKEIFKDLLVFNGHLHRPQRMDNIVCLGSPYPIRFNNLGDICGSESKVYILDTDTGKLSEYLTHIMNRRKIILYPEDFEGGFLDLEKFFCEEDEGNQFKFEIVLQKSMLYKYSEYVSIVKRTCKTHAIEYHGCQCTLLKEEEVKSKKKKKREREETPEDILKRYGEKENLTKEQMELALILMEEN